jgi:hypothetical protein
MKVQMELRLAVNCEAEAAREINVPISFLMVRKIN